MSANRLRAPVIAVAGLCCLTACGSAASPAASTSAPDPTVGATSTPTPSVAPAPATGARIQGSGYTLRVPAGWHDITARLSSISGVDRAAAATRPVDGFASNVNVVVTPGGMAPGQLDMVTEQIRARMAATAPSYAVLPRTQVAGAPTGHLAGLRAKVAQPYWLEQYVVVRGDRTYIISFSFSPSVPPDKRAQTMQAILETLAWTPQTP